MIMVWAFNYRFYVVRHTHSFLRCFINVLNSSSGKCEGSQLRGENNEARDFVTARVTQRGQREGASQQPAAWASPSLLSSSVSCST